MKARERMSSDSELFDKADALLARYRSASAPDFPVLTEVVELHPVVIDEAEFGTGEQPFAATNAFEIDLVRLQARLEIEITQALESVTMTIFDRLMATHLRDAIEAAVIDILGKAVPPIRQELIGTMREAVTVSVQNELQKLGHFDSK